jgi:hypothetical protein
VRAKSTVEKNARADLPEAVEALARERNLDPKDLLGWAVRADGTAVIIAPDGRKYLSGQA